MPTGTKNQTRAEIVLEWLNDQFSPFMSLSNKAEKIFGKVSDRSLQMELLDGLGAARRASTAWRGVFEQQAALETGSLPKYLDGRQAEITEVVSSFLANVSAQLARVVEKNKSDKTGKSFEAAKEASEAISDAAKEHSDAGFFLRNVVLGVSAAAVAAAAGIAGVIWVSKRRVK